MIKKVKEMFKKFFTSIKENRIVKKISKFILPTIAIVSSTVAVYFGMKAKKLKTDLSVTDMILSQTKSTLCATSAQATQLMLDNEVLADILGRFLHVPSELYT